jgi:hypothetical protein
MTEITFITDEVRSIDADGRDDRVLVDPAQLPDAIGWELKPQGLCQGDVCVPVANQSTLFVDGQLDLAAVAGALHRPVVVDADAGVVAMALDAEARHQALDARHAPAFSLPDLEGAPHSLSEWSGRKKLLLAFASW